MKKIINLIIVFTLFCVGMQVQAYSGTPYGGTAPVLTADGILKIEVENYDNGGQNVAYYSTRSTKATSYRTDEYVAIAALTGARGVSLTTNEWLKYTIDVQDGGTYHMILNAVALNATASINVYVDDVKVINSKRMTVINPAGNYVPADNEIGDIELESGIHVIKLENPGVFFYPNLFSLQKVASNEPYADFVLTDSLTVEAEDYDMGGQNVSYFVTDETYSENYRTDEYVKVVPNENNYSVVLQSGEWVEYTIVGEDSGLFLLTLAATENFEIYVNDIIRAENAKTAAVEISNGKNVIKIKSRCDGAEADSFKLEKLGDFIPYEEREFDGETPVTIEAENFDMGRRGEAWLDNTDGGTGLYRFDSDMDIVRYGDGYALELDQGEWAGYSINSAVDGSYSLWINASPISKVAKVSVRNGDTVQYENAYVFANGGDKIHQYIGEIKLDEGDNRIILENSHSVKLTVDNIVLKKNEAEPFAEINVPGDILPHLYDVGGMYDEKSNPNGGYSSPFRYANGLGKNLVRPYDYIMINTLGSDYYISAQPNDWTKYTVNATEGGRYAFYMRGQISAGTGKMDVWVNDTKVIEEKLIPVSSSVQDTFIGIIELEKGKNTIKSESVGGSGYFFTHLKVVEIQPSEMKSAKAVSANNTWSLMTDRLIDADVNQFVIELTNDVTNADGAITLKSSEGTVPAEVSVSGGKIIVDLSEPLDYNTEYTLSVAENKIEDLYGNKYAENYEWNFVTAGAEVEVTETNVSGTTAEVTVRNNSYTESKSAVLIFASYNDDGLKEVAELDKKSISARSAATLKATLKKPLEETDTSRIYVWNGIDKLNPIYGAGNGGIKEIVMQMPYADYDRGQLVLKGTATAGEKITYVVTKPGKKPTDASSIYYIGETLCLAGGGFNIEVPLKNAEASDEKYGIYIGGNKLDTPYKSEISIFDKNDVVQAALMLKGAEDSSAVLGLLDDENLKFKEKLNFTNPLYDSVNKENLAAKLYAKRNDVDENNLLSAKNMFDETLIALYFTEAETAENIKSALAQYAADVGLQNAFLYGEYIALTEDEKLAVCEDMKGKKYETYDDITAEFSISNIRSMFANAASYNDIEAIMTKLYEYIDAESLYKTYMKSSKKQDIEKYMVLNYKAESIKTPEDVKTLFSSAVTANGTGSAKPSYSSGGGGSGGSGSSSSGGMQMTYPTQTFEKKTELPFDDVSDKHWAYEYIKKLFDKGIVNGKTENGYCPDDAISREEFVKIAVGAFSIAAKSDNIPEFADVPNDAWYYDCVTAAASNGIINGTGENIFGTGGNITRQQMAAIIYRIISGKVSDVERNVSYGDYEQIDDYAKNAVCVLTQCKIISGDTNGLFRPQDSLTRAEAAKVIYTANEFINGGTR